MNGQQWHEKCLASLAIKEMQIKSTLRFYRVPVSMPIIKNTQNDQCRQDHGCRRTPPHCGWEGKLVQLLWKSHGGASKIKNRGPFAPAILLLSIYKKPLKSAWCGDTHVPIFIGVYFIRAKIWNQPGSHPQISEERRCDICKQQSIVYLQGRMKLCHSQENSQCQRSSCCVK